MIYNFDYIAGTMLITITYDISIESVYFPLFYYMSDIILSGLI